MKIYASNRNNNILERIIGKDVWILVDILEAETWAEKFYKRYFIQIDGKDSEFYSPDYNHSCQER